MDFIQSIGKALVIFGVVASVAGVVLIFGSRLGIGRLPGDILFRRGNFTLYFPLVTSIVLSIVLTILFNLFRLRR